MIITNIQITNCTYVKNHLFDMLKSLYLNKIEGCQVNCFGKKRVFT